MKRSFLAVVAVVVIAAGCRSTSPQAQGRSWSPDWSDRAVEVLGRPLPGPMAALYRMRVPSTGGLRLGIIVTGNGHGRMTISEPFGAAVMIAGWDNQREAEVFDLEEGCRLSREQAMAAMGLGALPLDRATRLLGGRLPDRFGDEFRQKQEGVLVITGPDFRAEIEVDAEPWRVVAVRSAGYTVELDKHTSSLPGRLRIKNRDGDSAELILGTLKWEGPDDLSPLPVLPVCGG